MRAARREAQSLGGAARSLLPEALMLFRHPAERLLSHALRQVARRRPDVFERLGPHRDAVFHVAPAEFPVAFQLRPSAAAGEVRVKRKADTARAAATIEGPFGDLLGVFGGAVDADSAYFSRRVIIEGRTEAVVALHNALDAADLDYGDLFGGGVAGRAAGRALEAVHRFVAWRDRPAEGRAT